MLLTSDDSKNDNEVKIDDFDEDTDDSDADPDCFPDDGMAEEPDELLQLLIHAIERNDSKKNKQKKRKTSSTVSKSGND